MTRIAVAAAVVWGGVTAGRGLAVLLSGPAPRPVSAQSPEKTLPQLPFGGSDAGVWEFADLPWLVEVSAVTSEDLARWLDSPVNARPAPFPPSEARNLAAVVQAWCRVLKRSADRVLYGRDDDDLKLRVWTVRRDGDDEKPAGRPVDERPSAGTDSGGGGAPDEPGRFLNSGNEPDERIESARIAYPRGEEGWTGLTVTPADAPSPAGGGPAGLLPLPEGAARQCVRRGADGTLQCEVVSFDGRVEDACRLWRQQGWLVNSLASHERSGLLSCAREGTRVQVQFREESGKDERTGRVSLILLRTGTQEVRPAR